MQILVVGGAGYIGSHVVYELIRKKYDVVVLDDLSTGNRQAVHHSAKFYEGNQLEAKMLDQVFGENHIDVVMHFSGMSIVPESVQKPIAYFENNVYGVTQILRIMNKFKVKKFIFSSTAAVYGATSKNNHIHEEQAQTPIQPYGQSKLACEWLIRAASKAHHINYAIFRYFNVAGADVSGEIGQSSGGAQKLTHLIPIIMEVASGQRPVLEIYGNDYDTKDGTCIRDYIHVTDLAHAHIMGIDYIMQNQSNTFNLGSNEGFSVLEILKIAKRITKSNIPSRISKRRDGDPPFLVALNQKVKDALGWTPQHLIEEIIASDYQWRRNIKF